jgi:hypothetical protein
MIGAAERAFCVPCETPFSVSLAGGQPVVFGRTEPDAQQKDGVRAMGREPERGRGRSVSPLLSIGGSHLAHGC